MRNTNRLSIALLVLTLIMSSACIVGLPPKDESNERLLFFSDFGNDVVGEQPSGITVYTGNPTVTDELGRNSVFMQHPNYETDYKGDGFYISFEPQTESVSVELWAYLTGTSRSLNIIAASDYEDLHKYSTDNCGPYIQFDRYGDLRTLGYDEGNKWTALVKYEANTWHHVRIDIDVKQSSFTVYLNNVEVGSNIAFFRDQTSLNSLFIRQARLDANTPVPAVYIDSIRIERN